MYCTRCILNINIQETKALPVIIFSFLFLSIRPKTAVFRSICMQMRQIKISISNFNLINWFNLIPHTSRHPELHTSRYIQFFFISLRKLATQRQRAAALSQSKSCTGTRSLNCAGWAAGCAGEEGWKNFDTGIKQKTIFYSLAHIYFSTCVL